MHSRPVYQSVDLPIHLYSIAAPSCIIGCNSQVILLPSCFFLFSYVWIPILSFANAHPLIWKMENEYDWLSLVGVGSLFDQSCDVEGMWKASSCGGFTLHLPLKCKISRPKLCINTLCIVYVISTHVKGPCDNGGRGISRHQHEDKRSACINPTEGSLITCAKNICLIIVFPKYIFF